ncbi:MAG: MarC family protein [Verrucomicrobiota bacterium]|nr:MarC family protein [Limisphaera sp.]MDW8382066.1 MarC family protein [Verrucomicrobiota bacterium]
MMDWMQFGLLAFGSLFVIVDPVSTAPAFLAMTPQNTPEQRIQMARTACLVAALVLVLFAAAGEWIFRFLGITLPAFQIAASVVLMMVALDMLKAQRSRVQETREETEAGAAKEDISVTPLAIPLLAGPGAISTVILLQSQAKGWTLQAVLYAVIAAVMLASYAILHTAARSSRFLNPIALNILARIMGLLLAAVAVQFMVNALRTLKSDLWSG